MTLVAYHGFGNAGRPIFLSDILVASKASTSANLRLPTVGRTSHLRYENESYKLDSLCQKVAILNDNLAIAVSGDLLYARDASKYLGDLYSTANDYTPEQFKGLLLEYLRDPDTSMYLDRYSVLLSHTTIKDGRQIGHNVYICPKPDYPVACQSTLYEEVLAFGSGSKTYMKFIRGLDMVTIPNVALPQIYNDLARVFMSSGRFLAAEIDSGCGYLNEYWGGGFEITAFAGGFHKLSNVLYIVVNITFSPDAKRFAFNPVKLIKTRYVDDHLFLRSLDVSADGSSRKFRITQDHTYYVPPLCSVHPKPRGASVEFDENHWICFCSSFRGPTNQDDSFVMVVPDYQTISKENRKLHIPPCPCSFSQHDAFLEMKLSPQFIDKIAHAVYDHADKGRPRIVGWIWH